MIVKEISASRLLQGDILEQLRFAFASDPDAFKEAFAAHGLDVSSDCDLKTLANLSVTGQDKKGVSVGGQTIVFDTAHILNSYIIRYPQINESGIKFTQ